MCESLCMYVSTVGKDISVRLYMYESGSVLVLSFFLLVLPFSSYILLFGLFSDTYKIHSLPRGPPSLSSIYMLVISTVIFISTSNIYLRHVVLVKSCQNQTVEWFTRRTSVLRLVFPPHVKNLSQKQSVNSSTTDTITPLSSFYTDSSRQRV